MIVIWFKWFQMIGNQKIILPMCVVSSNDDDEWWRYFLLLLSLSLLFIIYHYHHLLLFFFFLIIFFVSSGRHVCGKIASYIRDSRHLWDGMLWKCGEWKCVDLSWMHYEYYKSRVRITWWLSSAIFFFFCLLWRSPTSSL